MALPITGLSVPTFEDTLSNVILSNQELISSSIAINEDTLLGQLNLIMSSRIALANEGLQDVYDQRNLDVAEGKALDDNVSWLGIKRQGSYPTNGEQWFVGVDGTILPSGAMVRNSGTGDLYTLDTSITISRLACKSITISVKSVTNSVDYTITLNSTAITYTSDSSATSQEIITGIVDAINAEVGIVCSAVDNGDITLIITSDDSSDFVYVNDPKLKINEVVSAGNISCSATGVIQAPSFAVDTIITPVSGLTSTYNPLALISGRDVETDVELRARAKLTNSVRGKATPEAIRASVLNVDGVVSVVVNQQYVSMGENINGQPAGSIQLTVEGGDINNDIAQSIFDSAAAGVEVWAVDDSSLESGDAVDEYGGTHIVEWNRPIAYPLNITITYYVYDTLVYPTLDETAQDAIAAAVVAFGNKLNSGEDVYASEFEGSVYSAVGGIYRVYIEIEDPLDPMIICDSNTNDFITIDAAEKAYFEIGSVIITNLT